MKVTYIYHSGFLVETEPAVFLFDYYKGELPAFPADKPLVVFASHKHPDHFSFKIFDLQSHPGGVTYVFGNDIKLSDKYLERHGVNPEVKKRVHRMPPHTELVLSLKGAVEDGEETVVIHTLKSTDIGVAFYVKAGNRRIYHGGDLNWWHWKGETEDFNKGQENLYKAEIDYLKELLEKEAERECGTLDLAFVPLDPRQEDAYCYGMDYFLSTIPVEKVYPMHMWEDYGIIERYLENRKRFQKHIFFTKPS